MLIKHTKGKYLYTLLLAGILLCILVSVCACSKKSDSKETETSEIIKVNGFTHDQDELGYYSAVEWIADVSANEAVFSYAINDRNAYYVVNSISYGLADGGRLYSVDLDKMYKLSEDVYRVNGMISNAKADFDEISQDITPDEFGDGRLSISSIYAVEDGIYVLAYMAGEADNQEYFLYKLNSAGEILQCMELGNSVITQAYDMGEKTTGVRMSGSMLVKEEADGFVIYFGFFGKESLIVAVGNDCKITDSQTLEYEINAMTLAKNGEVYIVYSAGEGTGIVCYNEEKGIVDMGSMTGMSGNEGVYPACRQENGFIYTNTKGAYSFDIDNKTFSQFISWNDVGMASEEIVSLWEPSEGRLISIGRKNNNGGPLWGFSLIYLVKSDEEYTGKKQKITIGTAYESQSLTDTVRLFNSSNSMYEAEIIVYDDYERLGAELISGKGPDLFDTAIADIGQYARNGIIEDLNKYLDREDTLLSADMLVDAVREAYTRYGVLTCIPATFGVDCFAGRKSVIGEGDNISRQQFMDILEMHPGMNIVMPMKNSGEAAGYIVSLDYKANEDFYVDMDKHTAHFDSEEFLEILKLAASHEVEICELSQMSVKGQLDNERLLLFSPPTYVNSVAAYLELCDIAGEDGNIVGYPVKSGETAYGLATDGGFAMNANSSNKDAAWAFIEFSVMIQSNYAKDMYSEFPVLKSALEEIFTSCTQIKFEYDELGNLRTDADGVPLEKTQVTIKNPNYGVDVSFTHAKEEDIENIYALIDNMSIIVYRNSRIESIISEEVENMLNGISTPEETASVIQGRVQLILDEWAD